MIRFILYIITFRWLWGAFIGAIPDNLDGLGRFLNPFTHIEFIKENGWVPFVFMIVPLILGGIFMPFNFLVSIIFFFLFGFGIIISAIFDKGDKKDKP